MDISKVIRLIKLHIDESMTNKYSSIIQKLGFKNNSLHLSKLPNVAQREIFNYLSYDITLVEDILGKIYMKYNNFREYLPYELFSTLDIPEHAEYSVNINHLENLRYSADFSLTDNYIFIIRQTKIPEKVLLRYAESLVFRYKLEQITRYRMIRYKISELKIKF